MQAGVVAVLLAAVVTGVAVGTSPFRTDSRPFNPHPISTGYFYQMGVFFHKNTVKYWNCG